MIFYTTDDMSKLKPHTWKEMYSCYPLKPEQTICTLLESQTFFPSRIYIQIRLDYCFSKKCISS